MAEQNKSSVAELIHFVGLILLSIGVFIGVLYWQNGSLVLTIPITMVFLGGFFGLLYVLLKLQGAVKNPTQMKKWEYIVLFFGYGGLAAASLVFFAHFMDFQFIKKSKVQNSGMAKVSAIENLFSEYDEYVKTTADTYGTAIKNNRSAINGKKKAQDFFKSNNISSSSFTGNIEEDVKTLKSNFSTKLRENLDVWNSSAAEFVNKGKSAFNGINPINVPIMYNNANANYDSWSKKLIANANALPYSKTNPFTPKKFSKENDISFSKLNPSKSILNPLTLISFILLNIMILWPYLFGKRSKMVEADGKSGEKLGGEL